MRFGQMCYLLKVNRSGVIHQIYDVGTEIYTIFQTYGGVPLKGDGRRQIDFFPPHSKCVFVSVVRVVLFSNELTLVSLHISHVILIFATNTLYQ